MKTRFGGSGAHCLLRAEIACSPAQNSLLAQKNSLLLLGREFACKLLIELDLFAYSVFKGRFR
jgi:hypothetical protein